MEANSRVQAALPFFPLSRFQSSVPEAKVSTDLPQPPITASIGYGPMVKQSNVRFKAVFVAQLGSE